MSSRIPAFLPAAERAICQEAEDYLKRRLPGWAIDWKPHGRVLCNSRKHTVELNVRYLHRWWHDVGRRLIGPWLDCLRWMIAHEIGHAIRVDAAERLYGRQEGVARFYDAYLAERQGYRRMFARESRLGGQIAYLALVHEERRAEAIAARLTGFTPRYMTRKYWLWTARVISKVQRRLPKYRRYVAKMERAKRR